MGLRRAAGCLLALQAASALQAEPLLDRIELRQPVRSNLTSTSGEADVTGYHHRCKPEHVRNLLAAALTSCCTASEVCLPAMYSCCCFVHFLCISL